MSEVAIVGAGMAGLTCARGLADAGHGVRVFEKARGPGGRLSTRRRDGVQFDHGAQYFTARDAGFREAVDAWRKAGVVEVWRPRLARLADGVAHVLPVELAERERLVGQPRMSALGRHLARGLDVRLATRVEALERAHEGGWSLRADDGADLGRYDAVVLALPARQAEPLLVAAAALRAHVASARLAPCQAALLAWDAPLGLPFDAAFVDGGPLSWVARDSHKPGRPAGECWVLHASPEWSAAHEEDAPARVASALHAAFAHAVGRDLPPPIHQDAHRWRYALPEAFLEDVALLDASLRLGVCGDWCAGDRLEAAWRSGRALGERLQRALPG